MAYFPTFTLSLAVNIGTKYSTPYISASYVWDISQTPIPNHIMATATWDYLGTIPTSNLGYDSAQVTQVSAKSPLARPRPHGNWIWLGIFFGVGCSGTGPKGSSHFFDMIPVEIDDLLWLHMTSYGWEMLETGSNHDTDVMQIARNSLNGTSSPQPTRPAAKSPGPFTRSRSAGRDAKNQEVVATGAMVGMVGPFPSRCVIKTY